MKIITPRKYVFWQFYIQRNISLILVARRDPFFLFLLFYTLLHLINTVNYSMVWEKGRKGRKKETNAIWGDKSRSEGTSLENPLSFPTRSFFLQQERDAIERGRWSRDRNKVLAVHGPWPTNVPIRPRASFVIFVVVHWRSAKSNPSYSSRLIYSLLVVRVFNCVRSVYYLDLAIVAKVRSPSRIPDLRLPTYTR